MSKKCTKCNKLKQLVDFHKSKGTKDGYLGKCKECRSTKTKKFFNDKGEKKCADCKEWKHTDNFGKTKNNTKNTATTFISLPSPS